MTGNISDDIVKTLTARAERLNAQELWDVLNGDNFILAGGALCDNEPNDYDIYGAKKRLDLDKIETRCEKYGVKVLASTTNALTVEVGGQTVQFCRYWKNSLMALVQSFDFAHCQAGALFKSSEDNTYYVDDVYNTSEFIAAQACRDTCFTGSEYPLSSLMRAGKFYKQGKFANAHSYRMAVLEILRAVMERGMYDYKDIVDQMTAVSEGIEETKEAMMVSEMLKRDGNAPKRENEI